MKQFFNDYAANIDTYIMFKIKEKTANLTEELTKRNRKPISLAMGAPTTKPPVLLIDNLKKYLDEDGDINYLYSDNKNDNANCYHLTIHYNQKTNGTTYSLYGSEYYFEYSSLIEDDCIIEDFFDDNNLVLTYDGATVYKGKYDPKEPIDPDKELESIINGETEVILRNSGSL